MLLNTTECRCTNYVFSSSSFFFQPYITSEYLFISSLEVCPLFIRGILMLCIWGLANPEDTSLDLKKSHLWKANQSLQSPHPQPSPLLGPQSQGHYPLALIIPETNRQFKLEPVPQSLWKSFKLDNPRPTSPASPALPWRVPAGPPCWVWCTPSAGSWETDPSHGNLFLVCWSCQT